MRKQDKKLAKAIFLSLALSTVFAATAGAAEMTSSEFIGSAVDGVITVSEATTVTGNQGTNANDNISNGQTINISNGSKLELNNVSLRNTTITSNGDITVSAPDQNKYGGTYIHPLTSDHRDINILKLQVQIEHS